MVLTEGESLENQKQSFWRGLLLGCFCTMVVGVIAVSMVSSSPQKNALADTADATDQALVKLQEINEYIEDVFLFEVDSDKMADTMIKGYIAGLEDPYSAYYTAEEMEDVMESISGAYYGIGVMVNQTEDGAIEIVKVFSGSPAEESGILPGDCIIGVDDLAVSGMDMNQVIAYIKGTEGSTVEITVSREGAAEPLTMAVERRDVEIDTVTCRMLEDGIGYIQLVEFDDVSRDQLVAAIETLTEQGMTSMVLDLRDNPGGLLTSVVDIADLFLPEEKLIFYMEDKNGNRKDRLTEEEVLFDGPMTVLINENSASAAEVLSGCLKDHRRATLIGTTTFGKGIVQTYFDLSDGSGLKLTTDHYFTPEGTDIHGVGISPDITVEAGEGEDEDPQLERAIQELSA